MPIQTEAIKAELIDKVVALAHARLSGAESDATEAFIRNFYRHVPPDDLRTADPSDLFGAALAFYRFAGQRAPGKPKVRAYNPHFDTDGWRSTHSVIEIINDDMPFLVDSITAELNRRDLTVHIVIHPIFQVVRGSGGELKSAVLAASNGAISESFMHIEIDEQTSQEALREIENGITKVLADVRAAVADWRTMRAKSAETLAELEGPVEGIDPEDVAEAKEFLRWLDDNHFTYLGYREYTVVGKGRDTRMTVDEGSGLGLLRDPATHVFEGVRRLADLPEDVRAFLERRQLLIINKANMRSTVHRSVHMDAVGVKTFDKSGRVMRERLFVGLFTSTVYSRSPRYIPILRKKIDRTIARAGFVERSHDGKALLHILETFPRDELFQIGEDEIYEIGLGILHLQERQRTALFIRKDSFERFISCLVFVPRDRHDTSLRKRFQTILEQSFNGPVTAFYTQISEDSQLARIHFIVKTTPGAIPAYDVKAIERRLVEAGRSWSDELRDALIQGRGEDLGLQILRRFGDAFPTAYRERFNSNYAIIDIERIEQTLETGSLALNLYRPIEAPETLAHIKIYHRDSAVPLSDILPMLENMGLKVMDEVPYHVTPAGSSEVWIHDFGVVRRDSGEIKLTAVRDAAQDAFARIWTGEMENDGFNRLVIGAGLHWREVVIVRALAKYLRQAAIPFSQSYMEETLACNPAIARLLVDLFRARFDPQIAPSPEEANIVAEIETALEGVAVLDEDRIIRRFMNLVLAALRTNFYQAAEGGGPKPYVSIKFASARIDELPAPRPYAEIFVYSPRMEGVHLRGGPVARGGLRWSDRREDFRTEILGLMKAQMVKNAVIVPVGSKGGFVVKRPPAEGGRDALLAEGIECYKTLLRGMLDLTDNRVGDAVEPPKDVVRHDGDDPYLVVAADKGTATFSDYANAVSAEYGFWLRDAFASGGSDGYDHKKMGITARGAWEAVKRHFRELGKDTQREDFTAIGIGDMSGDVFGNGMLLSEHVRLIGAFNHLHIFVDPDPDPAASFAERKRLFELPRSSWSDYDPKLISKGGGVFDRKSKSIAVTPEMRRILDLKRDKVTPNELIRAILLADAELLWLGGIGTYVKASHESNADVGDRANDANRVDARDLRAKVAGEGANLGFTQRARIEFAERGGRINTDAIDNSAGVDCSDHEVNIKILLGQVVDAGDMTLKQRNALLVKMTDEVAELVLRDNYLQTQAITQIAAHAAGQLDEHSQFMRALERDGRLDRALEFLPDEEELADRAAAKQGLTRPEIAVLLAYAKIALYDDLLGSDLPDDPMLSDDLVRYFPKPLHRPYRKAIDAHRLRREIVATYTTNSMVNRMGPTFAHEMSEKSGSSAADVTRAYLVARDVYQMRDIWHAIEALDAKIPASVQMAMQDEARQLIERATLWFLRNLRQPIDVQSAAATYRPAIAALSGKLADIASERDRAAAEERRAALVKEGVPDELAWRIATLDIMAAACDIVRLADGSADDIAVVGSLFFSIGARFRMDWLRDAAEHLSTDDYWQSLAAAAIVEDLYGHQAQLTQSVLEVAGGMAGLAEGVIEAWIEARRPQVTRVERLMEELRAEGSIELAMLTVANRQLRALVAS